MGVRLDVTCVAKALTDTIKKKLRGSTKGSPYIEILSKFPSKLKFPCH